MSSRLEISSRVSLTRLASTLSKRPETRYTDTRKTTMRKIIDPVFDETASPRLRSSQGFLEIVPLGHRCEGGT